MLSVLPLLGATTFSTIAVLGFLRLCAAEALALTPSDSCPHGSATDTPNSLEGKPCPSFPLSEETGFTGF